MKQTETRPHPHVPSPAAASSEAPPRADFSGFSQELATVRTPVRRLRFLVRRILGTLWCFSRGRAIFHRNGAWHHWHKWFTA
jgi:hypothetical protein